MIVNDTAKRVDIQESDMQFLFGSFAAQYSRLAKHDPVELVIPMVKEVKLDNGNSVAVRYIEVDSEEARLIREDAVLVT